jgi:hypothetical protein
VLSREIDNSWSVSSSVIDIISQYGSWIHAAIRGGRVQTQKASENIFEIKRLTGYSWSKIAEVVGVDRRSITTWVGGGEIRDKNAQAIAGALATLRFIDRGSAEENRQALETAVGNGQLVFHYLVDRRHDEVRAVLGPGTGRHSLSNAIPKMGEAGATTAGLGREMLVHPEADPNDTTVTPDDTPAPVMRRVTAKRI